MVARPLVSDVNCYLVFRYGGCWGEGDIRKLAYFESSVDNAYATGKVIIFRIY